MNTSTLQTIRRLLSSQRKSQAHVKKRGEVSGSGRKPWPQKGTGNARAGSRRSSIWRGGGKAFGPRNLKNYQIKQNSKEKKAVFAAIFSEISKVTLDEKNIAEISSKTKNAQKYLNQHPDLFDQNILFIFDSDSINLKRTFKNISSVTTKHIDEMNSYNLLNVQKVLFSANVEAQLAKRIKQTK